MSRQEHMRHFVRNILGCTCPDKVFEQIEDRRVKPAAAPHSRVITIGGRLLIYIWAVCDSGPKDLQGDLFAMLAAGKSERDKRGLNRFRAVLAVSNPQDMAIPAQLFFSQSPDRDDRTHIHVVAQAALDNI